MYRDISVNIGGLKKEQTNKIYDITTLKNNLPFKSQIEDKENTRFIVKWDFDLNDESITIGENCILEFDGGSIDNGELIGQNTIIDSGPTQIFGDNIELTGTFDIEKFYTEWHGAKSDGETLCNTAFQKSCDNAIRINVPIQLLSGTYLIDEYYGTIYINMEKDGQNFIMNGAGKYLTEIKSPVDTVDRLYNYTGQLWDNNDSSALAWAASKQAIVDKNPKAEPPSRAYYCDEYVNYAYTFYAVPAYGKKYNNSYNAGTLKISNLTFNKNCDPEQIIARPRVESSWGHNKSFHIVPSYNGKIGTYKEIIFENIHIKNRIAGGIGIGAVECDLCLIKNITNTRYNYPWAIREAVIPTANAKRLIIDSCISEYYQIETAASQIPGRHVNTTISNCIFEILEWNDGILENPEQSSFLMENSVIGGFNVGGNYPMKIINTNFSKNVTIQNQGDIVFNNCQFDFKYTDTGLEGSIIFNKNTRSGVVFKNCFFKTNEKPEDVQIGIGIISMPRNNNIMPGGENDQEKKGELSDDDMIDTIIENIPEDQQQNKFMVNHITDNTIFVTYENCKFDVDQNIALFDNYRNHGSKVNNCEIKLTKNTYIATCGCTYSSTKDKNNNRIITGIHYGFIELNNCNIINNNPLIEVHNDLPYYYGSINGMYHSDIIINAIKQTSSSNNLIDIRTDNLKILNDNFKFKTIVPKGTEIVRNEFKFIATKDIYGVDIPKISGDNYVMELIDKNMSTEKRNTLDVQPPTIPIQMYDLDLEKPLYSKVVWDGEEISIRVPARAGVKARTGKEEPMFDNNQFIKGKTYKCTCTNNNWGKLLAFCKGDDFEEAETSYKILSEYSIISTTSDETVFIAEDPEEYPYILCTNNSPEPITFNCVLGNVVWLDALGRNINDQIEDEN